VGAALEVLLCSGFPTQLAIIYLLALVGFPPAAGQLSLAYVGTLLVVDASLVIALVVLLMRLHGEGLREVFLGGRPIGREALLGLPLTGVVFGVVIVVLSTVLSVAPWLHNVPVNPLEDLLGTRGEATIFAGVAIFAGGVREEMQRAFVLRRFERHLGGASAGVVIFSVLFGLGHALQGWDAAITTGTLGALWGVVYLARGSIIAPVVSHSIFNTAEIVRFAVWGS
jgi:membrane protease YdiL (CAAX protease family)